MAKHKIVIIENVAFICKVNEKENPMYQKKRIIMLITLLALSISHFALSIGFAQSKKDIRKTM
jgi:hypothetical protein